VAKPYSAQDLRAVMAGLFPDDQPQSDATPPSTSSPSRSRKGSLGSARAGTRSAAVPKRPLRGLADQGAGVAAELHERGARAGASIRAQRQGGVARRPW